ncbi:MAG: DegT/DnrJ/EryC1/StrS aminotransferase family protein [Desulfuromonadaceae bacterium]|nr:DegT/DnrJ/EryC1/StrS aminotransferase family protein [Desulfuromonadaceae bacterium]
MNKIDLPLMDNNITRDDLDVLIEFLQGEPRLTQGENVKAFEEEWSRWLGVKYSVYVNSGSSANLATIHALRHLYGAGEVIVPTLTWVSDISAVLHAGMTPVFVDIDPRTLCMDEEQVLARLGEKTRAVFMTYVQGFNGLSERLLDTLQARNIPLLEDVCESHGAEFNGQKLGSFGLASNFSFYYAHHMSTIEGGMISTNDEAFYQAVRLLRSHGMVRELSDEALKQRYVAQNPELNPEFIFAYPAFNIRGTEIGGVLGRRQLQRLDSNNSVRRKNLEYFLARLDGDKYRTDYELAGSCNYAFPLILRQPDFAFRDRLETAMRGAAIEFRRGNAGGGNQLRQPYLKGIVSPGAWLDYPEVEHVHHFGYYLGNFPTLDTGKIGELCQFLNSIQ